MMRTVRAIPRPAWRVLMHSLLIGLGMSVFDVLFTFFLVSQGYTTAIVGLLSTISRIAGIVIGVPAGRLIDRIGARRALILAVVVYVGASVVLLFAPDRTLLLASQFVAGCAFSLILSAMAPLLSLVTPHALQPTVFGFNEAAYNMIGLVGSVLAGVLPRLVAPWVQTTDQSTAAYQAALCIGLIVFLAAAVPLIGDIPYAIDAPRAHDDIPTVVPMRSTLQVVWYGMAGVLIGAASGTFFPFQSVFLRSTFHFDDAQVGIGMAVNGVALGIGAVVAGQMLGQRNLRVWSSAFRMLAGPALLCLLAPSLWVAVVGYVVRAAAIGASIALNNTWTMRLMHPQQRGYASSIWNMTWAAGWAATATLSGFLLQRYGFVPLLVMGAVAYVLSGLSILYLQHEHVEDRT